MTTDKLSAYIAEAKAIIAQNPNKNKFWTTKQINDALNLVNKLAEEAE